MTQTGWNVAVVGAAGMVGTEMIRTLEQRRFPVGELRPLDVAEVAGTAMPFAGRTVVCREATEANFAGIDIAIFSAGGEASLDLAPEGRPPGRRRHRQQLRLADGPGVPARRAGGEPARSRVAQGHHREPELLDHPDGRRAQAAPRPRPDQAGRRVHLPGGRGRRQERPRRTAAAGTGDSRQGRPAARRGRSSTSSRST